jgi:hypothetical protein
MGIGFLFGGFLAGFLRGCMAMKYAAGERGEV